jgi:hypothetical protein
MKVPKLQILTAAQILDNRRPQSTFWIYGRLQKGGARRSRPRSAALRTVYYASDRDRAMAATILYCSAFAGHTH